MSGQVVFVECYVNDTTFAKILEEPKHFKNFKIHEGLIYLLDKDRELLCIPDKAIVEGRTIREIVISEAHSLLAHLGPAKTVSYLRDHVWWKDIVKDVKAYCDTCETCAMTKANNQRPYGLLNPLEVPTYPWQTIGIDFVGPLPKSKNRDGEYDAITVVIDILTKMIHLIPSRTDYMGNTKRRR